MIKEKLKCAKKSLLGYTCIEIFPLIKAVRGFSAHMHRVNVIYLSNIVAVVSMGSFVKATFSQMK
jgi:hypothetical protein